MIELAVAIAAFLAAHMIPSVPGLRDRLVGLMGRGAYMAAYSILSLVLLGWVVVAALRAERIPLWNPAPWQWWVPLLVMPLSLWLLLAGLTSPNPLSVTMRKTGEPAPGGIVAVTRHPVLWGFALWGLSHVPPNGHLAGLVLFGGVALFGFLGMRMLDRRSRRTLGPRFDEVAASTSIVPFAAVLAGRARLDPPALLPAAAAAVVLSAWFLLHGHAWLIGRDPLAGL
jgi:uncharacterized membrane protein